MLSLRDQGQHQLRDHQHEFLYHTIRKASCTLFCCAVNICFRSQIVKAECVFVFEVDHVFSHDIVP